MAHEMVKAEPEEGQPRSIATWLALANSLQTSGRVKSDAEIAAEEDKDAAILVLLGKLALHYWRPDFSPGQARQLYADYLDDLREYAISDISDAITKYRRAEDSKFFPTPGQLVGIIRTVPDWSVDSRKEHLKCLHARAWREMEKVMDGGAARAITHEQ